MNCPFCHKDLTIVKNSRSTRKNSQIWRRRFCLNCKQTFTTHEIIDLSHLFVIKKSNKPERFSRLKLYTGIFSASRASEIPNREYFIDKIFQEVEYQILFMKKKQIKSQEITNIVLKTLRKRHTATFLRFLIYSQDIQSEAQLKKELSKYV